LIELKNYTWWKFRDKSIEQIKQSLKTGDLLQAKKQCSYCRDNGLRYKYVFEQPVPAQLRDKVTQAINEVFGELSDIMEIQYGVMY